MPPVIGITTYGRNDKDEYFLPGEYVDAVVRAGGVPVLLPHVPSGAGDWLARCDGLILGGGGDVDPETYGGEAHPTVYGVDPGKDQSDRELVEALLARRVPTLTICRGVQIFNVALGGTLHPHVPDAFGEKVLHRLPPSRPVPHQITIEPGSHLAAVLGATECPVVSWHHQAIDRPAAGLRVSARAADGLIEALELPDHPQLLAVQWHPELSAANDPLQQRLFDWLVQTSGKK
ncbi:MAG: gamma-glutamyl-gamma-aminobutyrate hydrolase family protein [Pirellulales bacterium]|nr:gamma-glutamyl-gamma-aminobutyrate hydrolase family protein [Pirellulales bacterium]